jgi:hypothetical protein
VYVKNLVDLLDHLHHPLRQLQKFQLSGGCYANRIPEWFRSLPMLAYLCIDVKEIRKEDLQLLSELSSLQRLSLSCNNVPTEHPFFLEKEHLVIGSS